MQSNENLGYGDESEDSCVDDELSSDVYTALLEPTRPGPGLAIASLIIPVIAGVVIALLNSEFLIKCLIYGTIVVTAVLMVLDLGRLARWAPSNENEPNLVIALLLLLIFWPFSFIRTFGLRSLYGGRDYQLWSVGSAAGFIVLPMVLTRYVLPAELPKVTDPAVVALLERAIRTDYSSRTLLATGAYREVTFDAASQSRTGTCVADFGNERISVPFRLGWSNREKQLFNVTLMLLPECSSPTMVSSLTSMIRRQLAAYQVLKVDSFEEVEFRIGEGLRYGRCVAHTKTDDIPVPFLIRWKDRLAGQYGVEMFLLPDPAGAGLQDSIRRACEAAFPGQVITTIEGQREIVGQWRADERVGACTVWMGNKPVDVLFVLKWVDQKRGTFQLELLQDHAI